MQLAWCTDWQSHTQIQYVSFSGFIWCKQIQFKQATFISTILKRQKKSTLPVKWVPSAQNLFPHTHQANYPLTLILCLVKVRTNPSPGSLCFFLVDAQTLAVKYWKGVWLFEAVWLSSETTSPSIKPSLRCVLVISFFECSVSSSFTVFRGTDTVAVAQKPLIHPGGAAISVPFIQISHQNLKAISSVDGKMWRGFLILSSSVTRQIQAAWLMRLQSL